MSDDVLRVVGGGYMVASRSVPGAWRYVHGNSCSCPAGGRRTCRHRRRTVEFERERTAPRPVATVYPSIFVD